jgi:hypothetical protein
VAPEYEVMLVDFEVGGGRGRKLFFEERSGWGCGI